MVSSGQRAPLGGYRSPSWDLGVEWALPVALAYGTPERTLPIPCPAAGVRAPPLPPLWYGGLRPMQPAARRAAAGK